MYSVSIVKKSGLLAHQQLAYCGRHSRPTVVKLLLLPLTVRTSHIYLEMRELARDLTGLLCTRCHTCAVDTFIRPTCNPSRIKKYKLPESGIVRH